MTKKLEYHKLSPKDKAYWKNEKGDLFVDIELEFGRDLTPAQRTVIMKHFILGFEARGAQEEYSVAMIDILNPHLVKMTVQLLGIPKSRALLALVVQLKDMFPVVRWNSIEYTDLHEKPLD